MDCGIQTLISGPPHKPQLTTDCDPSTPLRFVEMIFLSLFSAVLCFLATANSVPVSGSTVELVHVFFRHGDRTPEEKDFYPTDPYKNYSFYPMGLGQLTNKGKTREYNLGSLLRSRYNDFLGKVYTPDVVSSWSSDFDRTKMSLLSVLAGLWPPAPIQQWNPLLLWQPIPINYLSNDYDYYIRRPNDYCPRYLRELKAVIDSEEVQRFVEDNKDVFEYVQLWSEKPMKKPIDMFDVYQNLNAESSMNLTLPEWTKLVYPQPLYYIAGMQCRFENYNTVLIRLNGGRHLKYVIENGKAKINNELIPTGRKIYLISGHENNVNNMLAALNLLTSAHVPNYGNAIIFELHREIKTGKYGYKVFYHNSTTDAPTLLTVPGCTEFCPTEKFTDLTADYIPGNYTADCESNVDLN